VPVQVVHIAGSTDKNVNEIEHEAMKLHTHQVSFFYTAAHTLKMAIQWLVSMAKPPGEFATRQQGSWHGNLANAGETGKIQKFNFYEF